MNLISFNPEENTPSLAEADILSALKKKEEQKKEILQGMSPKDIAEIISDHLIDVIKKNFESDESKVVKKV